MLLDKVKLDITTDFLPNYQSKLPSCLNYKNLGNLTKQLIEDLVKVVFPGEQLVLTA